MELMNWIVLMSMIGFLDALYTVIQQLFPGIFAFCFTPKLKRTDCYEILHSKYSRLLIVPNSCLGVLVYFILAMIYSGKIAIANITLYGALLATIVLVISYYLLYVQAYIFKKFCIFCLISTTLMTFITILAWMVV